MIFVVVDEFDIKKNDIGIILFWLIVMGFFMELKYGHGNWKCGHGLMNLLII